MEKKVLSSIILLTLLSSGLFSCKNDKKINYGNLFFSEIYAGEHGEDYALEIGSKEEKIDFSGYKINFYSSKDLAKTLDLSDFSASSSAFVFINKDFNETDFTFKDFYRLDDNYIYGSYCVELINQDNDVVDSLGYKGYNTSYLKKGSLIRLKESQTPSGSFDKLNYIRTYKSEHKYLGNLNVPLSKDELLEGPKIASNYLSLPFNDGNAPKGGFVSVTVSSLGDGDTTFFKFPKDSGLNSGNSVRYLLIDTPEVDHGPNSFIKEEPWGVQAKNFNNEKLSKAKHIMVQSNLGFSLNETYGRYLGYIWYSSSDDALDYSSYRLLNFEMVKEGLAKFSTYDEYETMISNDILYYDYLNYANLLAEKNKIKIHGEKDPNFNY